MDENTAKNAANAVTIVPLLKFKNTRNKTEIVFVRNDNNKPFASKKHPIIDAIINSQYKFEKIELALARLENIKSHFITSSKTTQDENENTIKLWIRGFQIDEAEEKQGYLGNYAVIKINQLNDAFILVAEKLITEIKYHPQRKRPKAKHPDWGHPALRQVKKGMIFKNIADAQKILLQLHLEYPDVTILNNNRLFVIIYSKALNIKPPIQKFVLDIKTNTDGSYFIEYKANNYQKK